MAQIRQGNNPQVKQWARRLGIWGASVLSSPVGRELNVPSWIDGSGSCTVLSLSRCESLAMASAIGFASPSLVEVVIDDINMADADLERVTFTRSPYRCTSAQTNCNALFYLALNPCPRDSEPQDALSPSPARTGSPEPFSWLPALCRGQWNITFVARKSDVRMVQRF